MVDLKDCRRLEERMFYLGSHCKPLPPEPAPINRAYFNAGLVIHMETMEMRELKKIIAYAHGRLDSDPEVNDSMKELADTTFDRVTYKYNDICSKLSDISLPLIAGSKVVEHIRCWVDMNYKLIKDLEMKQFQDKYEKSNIPVPQTSG